jgi:hypothetical protein
MKKENQNSTVYIAAERFSFFKQHYPYQDYYGYVLVIVNNETNQDWSIRQDYQIVLAEPLALNAVELKRPVLIKVNQSPVVAKGYALFPASLPFDKTKKKCMQGDVVQQMTNL